MNTLLSGGRNGCFELCTMGGTGTITTNATRLYNGAVVVVVHVLLLFMFCPVTMTTAAVPSATTTLAEEQGQVNICERNGCNCTTIAHGWINGSCIFHGSQVVELAAKALPSTLMELHLQGAKEIHLSAGAFTNVLNLRLLNVFDVHQLRVRKHAFINVTWIHVRVSVHDCALAVLETHAFRNSGPASVHIGRCAHVVLQGETFGWLLALEITTVARLQLASQAFSLSQPDGRRHGSATTVLLQNVILAEIPQHAFPSLTAEVRFVDAHVRTVRQDAFYAITFTAVVFVNTSLQVVEAGAFSERTLVNNLELRGVHIGLLSAHAIKAAVNNLTIQHSNVSIVESGAVNITVAKVTLQDSNFDSIRTRGFVFSNWVCIQVENNTFQELEPDGLIAPFQRIPDVHSYEFTFMGNKISELGAGSLAFVTRAMSTQEDLLTVQVGGTYLTQLCHCELPSWLEDSTALIDTSKCAVDEVLARCLGVPQGWASIRNYTDLVCVQTDVIMCDRATFEMTRDHATPPASSSVAPPDREKKVLGLIFVAVVLCIIAILAVTGVLWLRRKGYCLTTGFLTIPTTTASCIAMLTRLIDSGVTTATTRTASQEYTELQQQNVGHRVVVDDGQNSEDGDYDEDGAPSEDKWTQTLPEELTQELLQQLREKLDDPENYSEARDMIEHLYDLIKVEESCSNNNKTIVPLDLDDYDGENVYDVIQPSSPAVNRSRNKSTSSPTKKQMCTVGTRAPSPDKLLPATTYAQVKERRQQAPVMCEYVEPRDRQQHLYTEVPGGNVVPPVSPVPETSSPTRRPLSFLRVLGESLQFVSPRSSPSGAATVPTPPPRPPLLSPTSTAPNSALSPDASLLCEYAEPTDAAVHVYSELPLAAAKMVNRPLPTKPDEEDPS